MRYRIAENEWNLRNPPWSGAVGIEDMIDPDLAVPPVAVWVTRGEGNEEFAEVLVAALNAGDP